MSLFPLTVKGAMTRRGGKVLAGPVDMNLDGGQTTILIGPNGAGKTSLLAMLHGTARLNAGAITWGCALDQARAAQAFVFQRPIVLRRTVLANIAYPLLVRGVPKAQADQKARHWAERVGLGGLLNRSALALSGGERQKLALARALIGGPALLFLDEPCAALDSQSMRVIEDVLQEAKAKGTTMLLATHDMGQARRLGDEVMFMLGGQIHERTPAGQFFAGPQTSEATAFLRGDIVG